MSGLAETIAAVLRDYCAVRQITPQVAIAETVAGAALIIAFAATTTLALIGAGL